MYFNLYLLLYLGKGGQTGRDGEEEGGGQETYGGGGQSQEGQERFHDTRKEEET